MTLDDALMGHATRLRVAGDVDRAEALETYAAHLREFSTGAAVATLADAYCSLEMLAGAAIDAMAIIRATRTYAEAAAPPPLEP